MHGHIVNLLTTSDLTHADTGRTSTLSPTSRREPADSNIWQDMAFKANETTPLLADSIPKLASDEDSDDTVLGSDDGDGRLLHDATEQPFNHWQIFALCCAAVTEPVACFCIFPFVSEMIQATGGLEESDVGFWAGAIESLFSVVQMGLMIIYGRMSDRFGRKPVLVFSLAGLSISTALFGLSRSLWQMVMFRCLAGSFAGSVLTVRIMVAESCNKSTEGRAFAWFMFARNGGILLGPVIGGWSFCTYQLYTEG